MHVTPAASAAPAAPRRSAIAAPPKSDAIAVTKKESTNKGTARAILPAGEIPAELKNEDVNEKARELYYGDIPEPTKAEKHEIEVLFEKVDTWITRFMKNTQKSNSKKLGQKYPAECYGSIICYLADRYRWILETEWFLTVRYKIGEVKDFYLTHAEVMQQYMDKYPGNVFVVTIRRYGGAEKVPQWLIHYMSSIGVMILQAYELYKGKAPEAKKPRRSRISGGGGGGGGGGHRRISNGGGGGGGSKPSKTRFFQTEAYDEVRRRGDDDDADSNDYSDDDEEDMDVEDQEEEEEEDDEDDEEEEEAEEMVHRKGKIAVKKEESEEELSSDAEIRRQVKRNMAKEKMASVMKAPKPKRISEDD